MKQTFTTFLCIVIISVNLKAQLISPDINGEYCPATEMIFTVTLPGVGYTNINPISIAYNVPPVVTQAAYDIQSDQINNKTTFKFKGMFTDYNNSQTFRIGYHLGNNGGNYDFTYKKIKSLYYADASSTIYATPNNITAQRCKSQTWNVTFSNVKFANNFFTPKLVYGTITAYEYLLPTGWKLNATTSNGSTWITATNNVTITSDFSHGVNGDIKIRAVNPCGASLAKGPITSIPISRPEPTLTISPITSQVICSGSAGFTINGMPSGATVLWQLSNNTEAQITGCNTCPTVNVTRTGTADITVTLSATVTDCIQSYPPKEITISLGKPKPEAINEILVDPYAGRIQVESQPALPGSAGGYKWYKDGVWAAPWSSYTGNYAQIPIARNQCGVGYGISVTATNACGVSAQTYKGVYVPPCNLNFSVSPNPASDKLIISTNNQEVKSSLGNVFDEVRIYDIAGNLKMSTKYSNASKVNLDVSQLRAGTYFVEIISGSNKEKHQILIRK